MTGLNATEGWGNAIEALRNLLLLQDYQGAD